MFWPPKKTLFLTLLAFAFAIGFVALWANHVNQTYTSAIEHAQRENENIAIAVAGQMGLAFRETNILQINLGERLQAGDFTPNSKRSQLQSKELPPQIESLAIISPNATLLSHTFKDSDDLARYDFFAATQHKSSKSWFEKTASKKLLLIQRVEEHGQFSGLIVASLSSSLLLQQMASVNLETNSAIFLVDEQLNTILQYPLQAKASAWNSAIIQSKKLSNKIQHETIGTRKIAYKKIANTPFYIVATSSSLDYLAMWRKSTLYYLMAGSIMLALAFIMSYYFWHSQRLAKNLKLKEMRLFASEARFRKMIESMPVGLILVRKPDHLITYINQLAAKMLNMPQATALSKRAFDFFAEKSDFINQSSNTEQQAYECILRRNDATIFWGSVSMSSIQSNDIESLLIGINDISERKNLETLLKHRATIDSLSGLSNRAYFIELASLEIQRMRRYQTNATLLMFDLDFFKRVNDGFGHHAGDLVIQAMAQICILTLREVDLIGRLGGEEFAAFLPETPLSAGILVAERLRIAIEKQHITLESGQTIQFTSSIGITELRPSDLTLDDPLIRADLALYYAKNHGRNQYAVFEEINTEH